jgi:hypothetical protein
LIEFRKDLDFIGALAVARREGKIIVPNCVYDGILSSFDRELTIRLLGHTGTVVIYEARGKALGDSFLYKDKYISIKFTIPSQFQGRTDCVLVAEHPDFELLPVGTGSYELKVPDENTLHALSDFPRNGGWHRLDGVFEIPVLRKSAGTNSTTGYLHRLNSGYLGPVARGVELDIDALGWLDCFSVGFF